MFISYCWCLTCVEQVKNGLDVLPVTVTAIVPADALSATPTAQKLFPCDSQRLSTIIGATSSSCSNSRPAHHCAEKLSTYDISECNHESTVLSSWAVNADENRNEEASEYDVNHDCNADITNTDSRLTPRIIPSFKRINAPTDRRLPGLSSSVHSAHHLQPVLSLSNVASSQMKQAETPQTNLLDTAANFRTVPRFTLSQKLKNNSVKPPNVNQNEKMSMSNVDVFNVSNEDHCCVTTAFEVDSRPRTLEGSKQLTSPARSNISKFSSQSVVTNFESSTTSVNCMENGFLTSSLKLEQQHNHKKKSEVRSYNSQFIFHIVVYYQPFCLPHPEDV